MCASEPKSEDACTIVPILRQLDIIISQVKIPLWYKAHILDIVRT